MKGAGRMRWLAGALGMVCLHAVAADTVAPLQFLVVPVPGVVEPVGDGTPGSGIGIDAMRRITRDAGVDARYVFAPQARIMAMMRSAPYHCGLGIGRTPEREQDYKWAGPVMRQRLLLYAPPGSRETVADPGQLEGRSIATVRGSVAAHWLAQRGLHLDEATDPGAGLKKLLALRVDFWAENELLGRAALQQAGMTKLPVALVLGEVDGYIACHLSVPDTVMVRLNAATIRARQAGALRALGLPPG